MLMAYLANLSAYSSKLDRYQELHQPRTSTATSVCSSLYQKDVWISRFSTAHHRYESESITPFLLIHLYQGTIAVYTRLVILLTWATLPPLTGIFHILEIGWFSVHYLLVWKGHAKLRPLYFWRWCKSKNTNPILFLIIY